MTSSQAIFKLPPVIGATVQPDPLESLYSPQLNKLSIRPLERDSVATSEFNDIALDDDPFSPVALSARPPPVPDISQPPRPEVDTEKAEETSDVSDQTILPIPNPVPIQYPAISTLMDSEKSHKRSASTITIRSTHNRKDSLLLNRLDLKEPNQNRGSVDGHLKLQEEFHRIQENQKEKAPTSESSIDWGVYRVSLNSSSFLNPCKDFWGAIISGL